MLFLFDRMKIFLVLLMVATGLPLTAQDWDVGSTWLYHQDDFMPDPDVEFMFLRIDADSIVGADTLLVLRSNYVRQNPGGSGFQFLYPTRSLIKPVGDSVFIYNREDQQLHLLYNFAAEAGDTIPSWVGETGFGSRAFIDVYVDSTGTDLRGGREWPVQYVHTLDNGVDLPEFRFSGVIYKGIGASQYFFPTFAAVDPPPGGYLLCHTNDSIQFPEPGDAFCSTALFTRVPSLVPIDIGPNPTTGMVYIRAQGHTFDRWAAFDVFGKRVKEGPFSNAIDLASLRPGVYFLQLSTPDGRFATKQIAIHGM